MASATPTSSVRSRLGWRLCIHATTRSPGGPARRRRRRIRHLLFEGMRERFVPDGTAHTKAAHHKSKFALRAAAMLHGGSTRAPRGGPMVTYRRLVVLVAGTARGLRPDRRRPHRTAVEAICRRLDADPGVTFAGDITQWRHRRVCRDADLDDRRSCSVPFWARDDVAGDGGGGGRCAAWSEVCRVASRNRRACGVC
jgi:hypothetical protein